MPGLGYEKHLKITFDRIHSLFGDNISSLSNRSNITRINSDRVLEMRYKKTFLSLKLCMENMVFEVSTRTYQLADEHYVMIGLCLLWPTLPCSIMRHEL